MNMDKGCHTHNRDQQLQSNVNAEMKSTFAENCRRNPK